MTENKEKIVTRFAPSPTGLLHGGNYRTAVFAYLVARACGGKFILRIEDTDRERSKKEYEENIYESLKWLGLEFDEIFIQSKRVGNHEIALKKLIAEDKAYISKEEAKDGSGVIKEIVRFRNPNKKVTWVDQVRGEITIDTSDLGDFVIAKSITEPVFHLAVVVDDSDMGVTHIIRGEDHIPNTPRHILIYEALGLSVPTYAHLPLVLDMQKAKLSKRHGAKPLTYYRDNGYLPGAILNFLAMIGWNPGGEQEIFTREELIKLFSLTRVQKSAGVFNDTKLEWINKEYIKMLPDHEKLAEARKYIPDNIIAHKNFEKQFPIFAPLLIDRISHFGEIHNLCISGEVDFYLDRPSLSPEQLYWKEDKDNSTISLRLEKVLDIIKSLQPNNTPEEVKSAIWEYAEKEGRGQVLWPTRMSLSGREKSPDPFTLISQLGIEESVARIKSAIELLKK